MISAIFSIRTDYISYWRIMAYYICPISYIWERAILRANYTCTSNFCCFVPNHLSEVQARKVTHAYVIFTIVTPLFFDPITEKS